MAVEVEIGLSKVEAGDVVSCVIGGETFDYIAKEPCAGDRGYWRCVTHDEGFPHNFAKDTHISDRAGHTLAWHCIEHGIETP